MIPGAKGRIKSAVLLDFLCIFVGFPGKLQVKWRHFTEEDRVCNAPS